MTSTGNSHWIIIKNNKIHERKQILGENKDISLKIRSDAFTEAQKERYRKDLEQNKRKIKEIDAQIKDIDNKTPQSPNENLQIDRGRSRTRESKPRYASPSPPIQHVSPRSVSSNSSFGRKIHRTDEDRSGSMHRLLMESYAENERLKTQLHAEFRRYGEEMFQLRTMKTDTENEDIYRLRVQNADLSIQLRSLLEENKLFREINCNLRLESEKMYPSSIIDLEVEKQSLTTMLQMKDEEVRKYKLELLETKKNIVGLIDEKQVTAKQMETLNDELHSLSDRICHQKLEYEEKLQKAEDKKEQLRTKNSEQRRKFDDFYNTVAKQAKYFNSREEEWKRKLEKLDKLQIKYDELEYKYQRELQNVETLRWKENEMKELIEKLERAASDSKISALQSIRQGKELIEKSMRDKITDLEQQNRELQRRICHQGSEIGDSIRKCQELQTELSDKNKEYEYLQAFLVQREAFYNTLERKAKEQNADLSERLKIESEDKAKLQWENNALMSKIDSDIREKDWRRYYSEKLANLQQENDSLKAAANQRERRNVETLQTKEAEMKQTVDEIKSRHEQSEKYSKEAILRERDLVEGLRNTIKDLEIENRDFRSRIDDMEECERRRIKIKKDNDQDLERLRQLEMLYKSEVESLKPNYTDLEKKFKQLQEENDRLLHSEMKERNKAENLQSDLNTEKRNSEKLRDRIGTLERHQLREEQHWMRNQQRDESVKELDRLRQLEMKYKSEAESLKTNQTDLEKKVKQLQEANEKHLLNESRQRNNAERLQNELHVEKEVTLELRARIKELEKERKKSIENLDTRRKHESDERDTELTRLRRLETFHKKETDTIQQKLSQLQKNFNLIQEERDNLREREEIERHIGKKAQLELEDAKREKERFHERITELERQITAVPKPYLSAENRQLKKEVNHLRVEVKNAKQKDAENDENVLRYERQVEALKREKRQAIAEKESALTRLSALAGDRLRDNNAAIADLSDENRPINLGEKFSELYDNQWTDAIEKLEKLMSERDAIQKLLAMIKDIYDVCRNLAKDQLDQIAKAFGFEERKEKLKRLKDFRKSMASENIGDIKKKVDALCVSKTFSRESSNCSSYISRSVELCWYMCIQDPPVILEFNATHGQVFDDKIYRHFTKSGKTIDYMVWPVMYLHSNGPLLQKGVVQPI